MASSPLTAGRGGEKSSLLTIEAYKRVVGFLRRSEIRVYEYIARCTIL